MIDDLYLGAYWRPRKESTEKCAERLLVCLNELAKGSEVFASWYDKARSKRDGKTRELELSRPVHLWPQEKVVQLLEMGRNRRDLDKSVIEELGYHVSLWNWGEPNRAISPMRSAKLDVHCGVYAEGGNYVVVDFPEDPDDLIEKEWALQALVAVVRAWEPDGGGIVSRASRSPRPFTPGSPFVDWMIYLN
ncbi:MAG TPA: hypothetical protein PKD54_14990, partial [Pirellulaceae bacterium]|nr:hypothetical protein [Pirellulaceae bacterium]